MNVEEFKKVTPTYKPEPKTKKKETSESPAWETVTTQDLKVLSEESEDGEGEEPDTFQEQDLCDALGLLERCQIMLAEMADPQLTQKLTRKDRDDMEQLSGEVEMYLDLFDPNYIGARLPSEGEEGGI